MTEKVILRNNVHCSPTPTPQKISLKTDQTDIRTRIRISWLRVVVEYNLAQSVQEQLSILVLSQSE